MVGTAANGSDVRQARALLHGQEMDIFGDAGYQGASSREDMREVKSRRRIAMRPGKCCALDRSTAVGRLINEYERLKASVRAKVEHPFRVIERQFGHIKVRYRELVKDTQQLHTLLALNSLWMMRHRIIARQVGP